MTGVLTNRGNLDTDRDRRTASREDEGRDGSDASTIHRTSKMPANPLKLGERRGPEAPSQPRRKPAPSTR